MSIDKNSSDEYFKADREEMLKYIPAETTKVLDIGCGVGNFGRAIKAQKPEAIVWGAEINHDVAERASQHLDKVIIGDICTQIQLLPDNFFDCVVFNDSFEHMVDPFTLLDNLKIKLSDKGVIVSSIPNIRYYRNLYDLVFKKQWEYTDSGIMDRTHLRFFTQKSIINMFQRHGYSIEVIEGINKSRRSRMKKLNALTNGWLEDTLYLQFASRVRPIR